MTIWKRSISSLLLAASCLGLCTGCAETSLLRSPSKLLPESMRVRKATQPARILCLWEQAEGAGHDGKPTRGFAGQILLFERGDASPVAVDGRVRIYQYDDFDPDEVNPKPLHVFEFDSAAWNAHRTMGTVGVSYNVFLPYMNKHNEPAECGLQVEFIPETGHSVTSAMTEIAVDRKQSRSRPQPALQRHVVSKPEEPSPAMKKTPGDNLNSLTIPLPKKR